MMLDHLGEEEAAAGVDAAVAAVLAAGEVRTRDIGGTNSTAEVGCRHSRATARNLTIIREPKNERGENMDKVKVGVAGFGVIGQRLADGVALQKDMELVGVADVAPTLAVKALVERGMPYDLYAAVPGAVEVLTEARGPRHRDV